MITRYSVLITAFLLMVGWQASAQSTVIELEYFINSDPGTGNGSIISISPGQEIDITDILSTSTLTPGFYTVFIRAKDDSNNWGFYESRTFLVRTSGDFQEPTPTNVTSMELFFDVDPGEGNGIDIGDFSSSLIIELSDIIPNSLTPGWHTVGVRARNTNGQWGFTEYRRVYVDGAVNSPEPVSKITSLEYYYGDTDPGIGNGVNIPINPAADSIDIMDFDIPTPNDLPIGDNSISIRAENEDGLWSFTSSQDFIISNDCVQPTAAFEIDLACVNEEVRFLDRSTNVSTSATYRWYLDGDDILDSNTIGDESFMFQNEGTYTVALVIDQGETCVDSTFATIEIKAKPIVVFNAERVDVGQPTMFEVFDFFVDDSFNWDWDFETDGTIDDNTKGSTTHTYPAIGTYMASVQLSDNAGCGTSFSREVSIEEPDGEGGGPEARFSVDIGCEGNEISFTDLSRDIPNGATYQWDFENDGNIDDNTIGDVAHIYSSAGLFTASLNINLPNGESLTHTEIVQVKPIPISSFTATTVCLGEETIFTNTSTGVDDNTLYSWDIDGDNNTDFTAKDGVSIVYQSSGQYSVLLTVDNGSGCFDQSVQTVSVVPMPTADFRVNSACVGQQITFLDNSSDVWPTATYQWDFDGDGTIDSDVRGNAFFTFTTSGEYVASLTIDNGFGCTNTFSTAISFQSEASPEFDASRVCFGETTVFTDLSSGVDPDAIYNWDFDGDGNIDSQIKGANSFNYPMAGSYNASLEIISGDCPARIEKVVFVNALPQPMLETDIQLCAGENIVLDPGEFDSYLWSDGSTNRTLQVNNSEVYTLTVTNEAGCQTTISEINVSIADTVKALFTKTSEPKDFSNLVTFESLSEGAESYLWDFGDGNTSIEENPAHEYTDINLFFGSSFEVCLTAFKPVRFQAIL